MSTPILITRERAFELIAALGDHPLDAWEQAHARNYELEHYLGDLTLKKYVIAELCPFNGIYCAWGTLTGDVA